MTVLFSLLTFPLLSACLSFFLALLPLFFILSLWLFRTVFIVHQHFKFVHMGAKNYKQSGLSHLSLFC